MKSTIGTELQLNVGTYSSPTWQKLYPIKTYSGFDVEHGTVDSTTMDNEEYTSKIKTLRDLGNLTFEVNEDAELITLTASLQDQQLDMRLYKKQTGVYHRFTGELEYTTMDGNANDGDFGKIVVIPSKMERAAVELRTAATVTSILDIADLTVDELRDVDVTYTPEGALITATSSNPLVVSTVASGSTIQLLGKSTGTATITVRVAKIGYVTATTTFDVTVV
jgi:hypothetical protein